MPHSLARAVGDPVGSALDSRMGQYYRIAAWQARRYGRYHARLPLP